MKLIETPVNSNLNIKTFYPKVVEFFFGNTAINYYKLFSLDRTQLLLVDTYDKKQVVMINTKKKNHKARNRLCDSSRFKNDTRRCQSPCRSETGARTCRNTIQTSK